MLFKPSQHFKMAQKLKTKALAISDPSQRGAMMRKAGSFQALAKIGAKKSKKLPGLTTLESLPKLDKLPKLPKIGMK